MSSRALRKLQRERELKTGSSHSEQDRSEHDENEHETPASVKAPDDVVLGKKAAVVNPFSLLNDAEHTDEDHNDDDHEAVSSTSNMPSSKSKRKKKKKSKEAKSCGEKLSIEDDDDIDATIRAVNEHLGSTVATHSVRQESNGTESYSKPVLSVEHRLLNPDNEVRRLFGSRVMQNEQGRRRPRNPHQARKTFLARAQDNWHQITAKTGLSMRLIESSSRGVNYFAFEHNKFYQKIQFEFLDAVESMNPQNVISLCHEYPFHIDTLLQVSEILKMSEDRQAAAEMIERALYVCETHFHPLFSLTQGNSRLDYKIAENRSFYLAMWRHLTTIGRKGCYRTALEYCKLILSLDPDVDPLCVLLMIDFYALRAEEYTFLIRMFDEWESHRNLSQLPNFAFSVPLAMFHQANIDKTDVSKASEKLQSSLLMFPGVLMPLVDKCNIVVDSSCQKCEYFATSSHIDDPQPLKQLEALYVNRCESCWKEPPVMAWLETNVRLLVERLADGTIPQSQLDEFTKARQTRYRGAPRNVYRHIVLSEIKEATSHLPPEIAFSPILSYDPLPPVDSIAAYKRPSRPTRAQQSSSPLAMFFRSLAPNFNPQEPVAAEADLGDAGEGAGAVGGGGAGLRQGVAAMMDAMRDLLNNIRFIPPPVENPEDGGDDDENLRDDEEWE